MKPTLRQLQLLIAVAEHETFSEAANTMCLTPSALSIQISQLEESMEIALFERIGRRKFLTPAGDELLSSCKIIFDELQKVNLRLTRLKCGMSGELKISAVTSAKFFVPHLLGAFHKIYPEVRFKLTIANRLRILERIEDQVDDLTIMAHTPKNTRVVALPILRNSLVLVSSPTHRLAKRTKIHLSDLNDEDFLLREDGSGTRITTEKLFSDHNISVNIIMELGSSEAIKQAILAELGISLIPKHAVWLELRTGFLVELNIKELPEPRPWYSVHKENQDLSPLAETFQNFIQENGESIARSIELLRH
ncbi:MAG: LysR family transcriptional regulator [Alphaproteobacteria bacterium]|nr:MAG: LysR family transcriptional regulator [Alphaproteobacteria bacterium]